MVADQDKYSRGAWQVQCRGPPWWLIAGMNARILGQNLHTIQKLSQISRALREVAEQQRGRKQDKAYI